MISLHLFLSEPVNIDRGSEALKFVQNFLKYILRLVVHSEDCHAQISSYW